MGASVEFPVKRCLGFLKEIGLESADVVLESDQENAIMDVLNNVAKRRSADSKLESFEGRGPQSVGPQGRAIHEASPIGSSGSNGVIERTVQAIEGQVRTIKLALESRIGVGIPSDHDVVPWIVEYAGTIINKGQVGADGKTAYERLKGKLAHLSGLEFGEKILWKSSVPARERRNKMDADWKHGVFLGQRALSGEYMVGTPDGICRPRSIHRRPQEKRWEDVLSCVVGMPWKLSEKHDGDKEVFLDENPEEASSSPTVSPLPPIIMEEPVEKIRRFYVTAKDVDPKHQGVGFTEGCKGCRAIVNGKPAVAHSDDCRLRVMAEAPNNDKIAVRLKRTVVKDHDYHARNLERNEEKRKK